MKSVKVWDIATRIFHWSIVICVVGAWVCIENRWIEAHEIFGYTLLTLLVFRLFWGVVGSTTARFSHFIGKPSHVISYLKDSLQSKSPHYSGHNPAGACMVIVLLAILFFQTVSGLYSNNDLGFTGPLADGVSKELSDLLTKLHGWNFNLILAAVWLHIVAVFFYVLVKKDNLIKAMITGKKPQSQAGQYQSLIFAHPLKALIFLLIAAVFVGWLIF